MLGGFAIAASRGEASKAAEDVAERESGSERVTGAHRRHVLATDIPRRHEERTDQPAGENSSRLQCVQAENLPPVAGIVVPFVGDEKNLGAQDSGQNNENPKIPSVVAVDPLLLGIADADPEPDQYAGSDQQAISRKAEVANVKKSRKHFLGLREF
jgi:hypothetical protein